MFGFSRQIVGHQGRRADGFVRLCILVHSVLPLSNTLSIVTMIISLLFPPIYRITRQSNDLKTFPRKTTYRSLSCISRQSGFNVAYLGSDTPPAPSRASLCPGFINTRTAILYIRLHPVRVTTSPPTYKARLFCRQGCEPITNHHHLPVTFL